MTAKPTVKDRIKSIAKGAGASMVPGPREVAAPPPKEEPEIPQIADLITDRKVRLELARLVDRKGEISVQVSAFKRELDGSKRAGITGINVKIKNILGKFQVGKAICGGWVVNYYNSPRSYLDPAKLTAAMVEKFGISEDDAKIVVRSCYSTKDSYTLKVGAIGQEDEEEE